MACCAIAVYLVTRVWFALQALRTRLFGAAPAPPVDVAASWRPGAPAGADSPEAAAGR